MKLVNEVLLKWFKQERCDSVPRTGALIIIFALPKF